MSKGKSASDYYDLASEYAKNGVIPRDMDLSLPFQPDDEVLSCSKLESGLRLGDDGIRACCMGAIVSPLFYSSEEAARLDPSREDIIQRRKALFKAVNDSQSGNLSCKQCDLLRPKQFKDVHFDRLGHVNLAHYSMCNLRCNFCGFTQYDIFTPPQYDALNILRTFKKEDVEWDAFVDLNGGEPTLLKDLDDYIDYFASYGIRILLYTNAVRYSQAIYDGVRNGTITWLITSLDAGTPSTFARIKGRDHFEKVLENLTRYAQAGSEGQGNLAVKYIFSEDNCSADDVTGFAYAMLAIRPQKVWLTFDFFPLADTYEGQEEPGVYDFSRHIDAYIDLYTMLKKHGLEPAHFAKTHLAQIMQAGKDLISAVEEGIQKRSQATSLPEMDLILKDFRQSDHSQTPEYIQFTSHPLRLSSQLSGSDWKLEGKRVLLAPAYDRTRSLLGELREAGANVLGFADRNPVLQKKEIDGCPVFAYEDLKGQNPDIVLIAAPEQHELDILRTLGQMLDPSTQIAVMERTQGL